MHYWRRQAYSSIKSFGRLFRNLETSLCVVYASWMSGKVNLQSPGSPGNHIQLCKIPTIWLHYTRFLRSFCTYFVTNLPERSKGGQNGSVKREIPSGSLSRQLTDRTLAKDHLNAEMLNLWIRTILTTLCETDGTCMSFNDQARDISAWCWSDGSRYGRQEIIPTDMCQSSTADSLPKFTRKRR